MKSSRIRQSGLDYTYNYQQKNGTLDNYGGWSRVYSSGTDSKTDNTLTTTGISFTIDGTVQKHVIFRSWFMVNISTTGLIKMKLATSGAGRFYEQNCSLLIYPPPINGFRTPQCYNFDNFTAFRSSGTAGNMLNIDLFPYYNSIAGIFTIEYKGSFFVDTGLLNMDIQWAQQTTNAVASRLFNNSYFEYLTLT